MMTEFSVPYILTAVLYVICLAGFIVNMIILAVKYKIWKSVKSLQTCDQILSFLVFFRALCFVSVIIRISIFQFFPWLLKNNIAKPTLYIQNMFLYYSVLWIATILCIFYCVKIVTYNYKLFIFLKTRISTMVLWLIPTSLLMSLISSLPYGWFGFDSEPQNLSNSSIGNITEGDVFAVPNFYNRFMIFSLGSFLPFVIFCAAISLLIHFLLIHTRRMRSNESHSHSPNLKSHLDAMKSMSLFLLLQIMSFICVNLLISGTYFVSTFTYLISAIIQSSILLLHSFYMMSTSSDVRKMFTSMCLGLIRNS